MTAALQRVAASTESRLGSFERSLAVILVIALVVRVAYILLAKLHGDTCHEDVCGDALYYSRQAELNVHGRFFEDPAIPGQPAADHPPLTALVLTPISVLPGPSVLPHRLMMAIIGVAAVAVIGYLARRLAGDRAGLLAAGIAAVYPNLWLNDGVIMSESLAVLMTALILLAVYRFDTAATVRRAVALGAAIGVGILARGELALFLPVVVLPVALGARELPVAQRLGRFAVVAAVAVGLLVPWTLFNLARFEEPVVLATNDGLTLVGANCEEAYNGVSTGLWFLQCAERVDATGDQSQRSATYRDEALSYIGDHTDRVPTVIAARVGRVWSLYEPGQMAWYNQGEGRERTLSLVGLWTYAALAVAAIAGVVVLRRRRQRVWPLVGTAVIVTLTAVLFYGLVRFRVPAEVAIVVLAAIAIDAALPSYDRLPDDGSSD